MNKRSHIHKKADSSASNPVMSQLQSRPFIAQAKPQPQKPLTQTQTETQEFQQQKFEATKLELQAKYGTITPEGQERLTVLQAKMSGTLQMRLEHASSFGHNFVNIPISRPDAPSQPVVQTKLTIGEPGDKYEQEADRVAAQVVNQINAPVFQQAGQNLQQQEMSVEEKELQMKPMLQLRAAVGGMTATADLETGIQQARGAGQPLAANIRQPMEQAFGADFSKVKVHTDTQADQLNQSIQAKAFTTGQDVFFRQGEYQPGSHGGQELLAHELTHVVQQNGGAVMRSQLSATGQADVTSPRGDERGNLEKGGLNFSYIQPRIQRAISLHQIQAPENQGKDPAIRQEWFKNILQQELKRIIQLKENQQLKEALELLEGKNNTAYWIVKDELLPYMKPSIYKNSLDKEVILTINKILNSLELEMEPQKRVPKEIANVLVGNEFTFTNSSLTDLKANDKDDLHEKMVKPYNNIAESWKSAMSAKGISPSQDYKSQNMSLLTYKFQFEQHGLDWEYKVTPDQKCVEIITGKAKAEDLYSGHIANLMDDYIFGIAHSIGLKAHETIGGGHINIDEKTAFGSYNENDPESVKRAAKVLAIFIQEFYKKASYWESIDPDTANSAFPKDLKYKVGKGKQSQIKNKQVDFEELIQKFNQEGWHVAKLADELMNKVFDINLVDATKEESPHYQALNVEHLGSNETGDTRRLEVRRVPAQPDRQALIEQLNQIADILKISKQNG